MYDIYKRSLFLIASTPPKATGVMCISSLPKLWRLYGYEFAFDNPDAVDLMTRLDMRPVRMGEILPTVGKYNMYRSLRRVDALSQDSLQGRWDNFMTSINTRNSVIIYSAVDLAKTHRFRRGMNVGLLGRVYLEPKFVDPDVMRMARTHQMREDMEGD